MILTTVERKTRLFKAIKLEQNTAMQALRAQLTFYSALPSGAVKSVTVDNGSEFAYQYKLAKTLGVSSYYTDPYSSWQKGSIENRNGILRRYFPKGTDFTTVTQEELDAVSNEINNRPLAVLGYLTPLEAFALELEKLNK